MSRESTEASGSARVASEIGLGTPAPHANVGFAQLPARAERVIRSKRVLDTALVVLSLPVVAPVAAATALAIRVCEGRPVLFRQKRLGYHEQTFEVLKFRTMRPGNGRDGDRNRITLIGKFLRRTSLDELPQLANVLRGEMSLVGPRPLYEEYKDHYTPRERTRHAVRPGITGNAQVNGRNNARWTQRLEMDVAYVEKVSLREDLNILVQTLMRVLKSEGVSLVARDTGEPLHIERSYPGEGSHRLRRLNVLDVDTRVEWMSDPTTARYMQFPRGITRDSTIAWLGKVNDDPLRDDFVVADDRTGAIHAMLGLKSGPGTNVGVLYIFTDPNRRGTGLGQQAIRLLISWAIKSRYKSILLTVDESNEAAVKLYEGMGFALTSNAQGRVEYKLELPTR